MKEKTIKFLQKYFDKVSSVMKPRDISYVGINFFEVELNGKRKILGLEDELIHWLVEKENKRLGFDEKLKDFNGGNIHILFNSGKAEWR